MIGTMMLATSLLASCDDSVAFIPDQVLTTDRIILQDRMYTHLERCCYIREHGRSYKRITFGKYRPGDRGVIHYKEWLIDKHGQLRSKGVTISHWFVVVKIHSEGEREMDKVPENDVLEVTTEGPQGPATLEEAHQFYQGFLAGMTAYARENGDSTLKSQNDLLRRLANEQGWKLSRDAARVAPNSYSVACRSYGPQQSLS